MRQLAGYAPAVAFPRVVAFATLIVFTHVLEPAEYGRYALVVATAQLLDVVCFRWLRLGLIRNYVKDKTDGRLAQLMSSTYMVLAMVVACIGIVYVLTVILLPNAEAMQRAFLIGAAYLLFRSSVMQNLELHRAAERVGRYSLTQCLQGSLGLALAVLLVVGLKMDERGLLIGQAAGFAVVFLLDLPLLARQVSARAFDGPKVGAILTYSIPLTISAFLLTIITTSDRYFLEFLQSGAAVGIYSASYSLARDSIGFVFMLVNVAAYPLAIKMFEVDGEDAARRRLRQNAAVMLAIGTPAMVGMVLVADTVSATILGEKFQGASGTVIGWIALAFFLSAIKAHIYDQAFHLARRTGVLIWTYVPAALLNLALNWLLIPLYGVAGAAYATVAAFALSLVLSVALTRRVFRIEFPVPEAMRVLVAVLPMIALLKLVQFPENAVGLLAMVALGLVSYGSAAFALDVMGMRRFLTRRVARSAPAG